MNALRRVTAPALAAGLLLLAPGCSTRPKDQLPVFPVHGKLTYKGSPMSWATVSLVPAAKVGTRNLNPHATADEDGNYRMTTYALNDGVPSGDYLVTIYWPRTRPRGPDEPVGPDETMPPDRLKMAYADSKHSRLRATVAERDNVLDFQLP